MRTFLMLTLAALSASNSGTAILRDLDHTDAAAPQRQERQERQILTVNGHRRTFVMRGPRDLDARNGPLPVVLILHGGGGNAAHSERMTGFTALVERERILVVYPEGWGRLRGRLLTWNAGHCCGYAMQREMDDVRFIDALLDTLIARYPVDTARIYVTGMSNGAMMAHRLGRELGHRIAAIAPVVGALFGDEPPSRAPVAALMINGTLDRSVPHQGGPSGGPGAGSWDGTPAAPSAAQGTYWARANDCASEPKRGTSGAVIRTQYDCPPGRAVELYLLTDNGHAWPGGERGTRRGDTPSRAINATEVIWAFFKANPKRRE